MYMILSSIYWHLKVTSEVPKSPYLLGSMLTYGKALACPSLIESEYRVVGAS